ncbi:Autophagy protein [Dirofilaria immitis]
MRFLRSMIQDYEVTRKLWDGRIPVQFILDKLEFMQCSAKPFCIMVPGMSYFPLILPRVLQYFMAVIDHFDAESVWLWYNTKPLKWHYPVGVLFDLLKKDDLLPWTIVLKTKDSPKEVMRFRGNDLESSYIQSVKEADQLKHKGRVVNSMKVDEHRQLWSSILHDKFDEFWAINKKLMESSENEPMLHVPIRIYQADCSFQQPLITPFDESDRAHTIVDALKVIWEFLCKSSKCNGTSVGVISIYSIRVEYTFIMYFDLYFFIENESDDLEIPDGFFFVFGRILWDLTIDQIVNVLLIGSNLLCLICT